MSVGNSGARGLGYNMAQALCEVGVKAIALMDVQQELGDQVAAELHSNTGIPVKFYKVDVRDGSAVQEVVANIVDTFGSVDVLINSAGIAECAFPPAPVGTQLTFRPSKLQHQS